MEVKLPGYDTQMKNKQLFGVPSSNYTYFADQAMNDGLWTGRSDDGNQVRSEVLRRQVDMAEAIHRELEKERMREKIVAEEVYRKRFLEVELRRELMIRREMEIQSGSGFLSSSLLGPSPTHHYRFEPGMLHRQSSAQDTYSSIGRDHGDVGGFEVVPFQQSPETTTSLTENAKIEYFGKPYGASLAGAKRKSPSSSLPSAGSSERRSKKTKDGWSCVLCKISAPCERGLNEHLAGKKHRTKMAALNRYSMGAEIGQGKSKPIEEQPLLVKNSSKYVPSGSKEDKEDEGESENRKFRFWCKMCKAGALSEVDMNKHKKGEKHLKNLHKPHQEPGDQATACDSGIPKLKLSTMKTKKAKTCGQ